MAATTASASASSFIIPSLNPNTLSLNRHISSLSFKQFHAKLPISSFFIQQQQQKQTSFVRNVAVSSEYDQEEDQQEPAYSEDQKLFVGNLPFSVDSAQLADLFEDAGGVEKVEVIYDKVTGRSRGFGFVTMSSAEEAEAAANQFNGYELDGRALRVNSGPPPQRDSSPRVPRFGGGGGGGGGGGAGGQFDQNRLYVGNLSWSVDDMGLQSFFSEHGRVLDAKVVYERESGRSRGFGFVTYSSAQEVESAIEALDGAELDGREIRVSVAEARPRRQF